MNADTAKRVTDYIDTLKASGAPHQQQLAEDLSAVMGYYKTPGVDERDATIEQLKLNLGQMIDERDAAREELKKLSGAAKSVPEEEHANLKRKSKS